MSLVCFLFLRGPASSVVSFPRLDRHFFVRARLQESSSMFAYLLCLLGLLYRSRAGYRYDFPGCLHSFSLHLQHSAVLVLSFRANRSIFENICFFSRTCWDVGFCDFSICCCRNECKVLSIRRINCKSGILDPIKFWLIRTGAALPACRGWRSAASSRT